MLHLLLLVAVIEKAKKRHLSGNRIVVRVESKLFTVPYDGVAAHFKTPTSSLATMESKRPGSGFFQNDVYKDLLHAMRNDDENKFNQILTTENVNVNKVYEKSPDHGTLLDFCSVEGNKSKYIATLLNRGANPNLINSRTKKGPIHQVALQEDSDSMRVLLESSETDPNLLDNFGSTALHYACKNNDIEMVQTILQRSDANVNITNRKGKSPLHIVLDKEPSSEYLDVLNALLSRPDLDVSLTDYDGVTLQQMIEESYPDLVNSLPIAGNDVRPNLDVSFLFQLLRRNNYRQFLNHVKGNRDILEGNDGSYTLLQYCCDYGVDDVAQALLDEGVDPNGTCSTNMWPPIMIACRKGYISIVKSLVNNKKTSYQPVNNETVLHCIVNGGYGKQGLSESNIERNYQKCLSYLLQKVPKGRIDVNYRDKNGNTALHYAAKVGDQNIVLEMLNAGAYIGVCNKLNEPACADITQSTMERHLDSCILTNDKLPRDEMYALIFNYGCLVPFNKSEDRVISNSSENFIKVPINSNDGKHLHKSVMLTGEFDSASIPFVLFPGLSRVLFVLFVFLIAIVLFNLLNGLAVSDTQAIKADAELVGYISQAKLISHIEEKVSNGFNCWGLLSTTFKFSNAINMFQDISEGKIKVYPNNANRVELDDLGLVKNRKHEESENCYEFKSIYMDPRIVKSAREILFKREHEKSHENYLSLVTEKENELRELLGEFKECLRQYKDINLRMNQQFRA
ncbi:hypothetical protein GE061_001631 [Apolygus lucorum]|uniref:Uncharacterized protein n=1 Tax=Apolygus lucorum TaxID=248454 RepID=A0A6A4KIX6_APOLU|nr:hypothetical protein GE061_001631 [Apolygus lucorum]